MLPTWHITSCLYRWKSTHLIQLMQEQCVQLSLMISDFKCSLFYVCGRFACCGYFFLSFREKKRTSLPFRAARRHRCLSLLFFPIRSDITWQVWQTLSRGHLLLSWSFYQENLPQTATFPYWDSLWQEWCTPDQQEEQLRLIPRIHTNRRRAPTSKLSSNFPTYPPLPETQNE